MAEEHPVIVLDLFCGSGGATAGYRQAWPDATFVGVDLDPKPLERYPGIKIHADALDHGLTLSDFDFIHASPPCQEYSTSRRLHDVEYPMLIDPVRDMLQQTDTAWVIENVEGSDLATQDTLFGGYGTLLCGTMFGRNEVRRHRLFETSFPMPHAPPCRHDLLPRWRAEGAYWRKEDREPYKQRLKAEGRAWRSPETLFREDMGLEWMAMSAAMESFPVEYTRYIADHYTKGQDNG